MPRKEQEQSIRIEVDVTTGGCSWFELDRASEVFAFHWPPFGDLSVKYATSPDLVHIVTRYRLAAHTNGEIYMERRLAAAGDERIAFHDALFISRALKAQGCGFATEMLRRCIPYYRRLGVGRVIIPSAVEAGRIVWPKFGFRPSEVVSAAFAQHVADLHEAKLGAALPQPVPSDGPGLLDFRGSYGFAIGRLALQTFSGLTLELDLADPGTIRSLTKRGIEIT